MNNIMAGIVIGVISIIMLVVFNSSLTFTMTLGDLKSCPTYYRLYDDVLYTIKVESKNLEEIKQTLIRSKGKNDASRTK